MCMTSSNGTLLESSFELCNLFIMQCVPIIFYYVLMNDSTTYWFPWLQLFRRETNYLYFMLKPFQVTSTYYKLVELFLRLKLVAACCEIQEFKNL